MKEEFALKLLKKYRATERLLTHSKGVSEIAFEVASDVENTGNVNPQKIKVASLLHDIGKCITGVHEINSVKILEDEGLEDLAEIVMHGFVYETFLLKGIKEEELLPKTLENKIVVFADFHYNQSGQRVSFDERINDIKQRHSENTELLAALDLALPRLRALEDEITSLLSKPLQFS